MPLSLPLTFGLFLLGFVVFPLAALGCILYWRCQRAPRGYQDAAGFHYAMGRDRTDADKRAVKTFAFCLLPSAIRLRGGAENPVARRAHNPEVAGSNPAPATNSRAQARGCHPPAESAAAVYQRRAAPGELLRLNGQLLESVSAIRESIVLASAERFLASALEDRELSARTRDFYTRALARVRQELYV